MTLAFTCLLGSVLIPYLVFGLLQDTKHKDDLDKLTEFDREFHEEFLTNSLLD